jgi:DNA-binding Lrp family transcriptional regulator
MKEALRILERDGKATPAEIAQQLGVAEDEVRGQIARAEAERVLLRYKAVINWEKLGEDRVSALIEVRVTPQRGVGFDGLAQRIYRFPEVRSVYLMSGAYDLAVQVVGRSMQEVASFVAEKLATLDTVQGTVTHFVLKRYKEDGEILTGDEETTSRLPVSP